MKVIIVGAGIAGLGAGIGLRRAGHDVQVHLPSSNQFQARESNRETQQS
jgi:2-polyprenyl-6-methoxyphenol hydroxylase-like FAD-dependent oxidoreductase